MAYVDGPETPPHIELLPNIRLAPYLINGKYSFRVVAPTVQRSEEFAQMWMNEKGRKNYGAFN